VAALVGDQDQRAGIQLDDKVVGVWYVHTTPKTGLDGLRAGDRP
jgi:hypothetical protein